MLATPVTALLASPELGISDEHNGILELPADAPVGTSFAEAYGLKRPNYRHRKQDVYAPARLFLVYWAWP